MAHHQSCLKIPGASVGGGYQSRMRRVASEDSEKIHGGRLPWRNIIPCPRISPIFIVICMAYIGVILLLRIYIYIYIYIALFILMSH